jgi:hypothetical protein
MNGTWLLDRLPPVAPINRRSEADYYGASDLIGAALGHPSAPRSSASWKHGIAFKQNWASPDLILTEGSRFTRHLVTVESQVAMLRGAGYLRVHAAGAPYLYVEPARAPRVPASLLIMPAHSVFNSTHSFGEDAYVEQLLSIQGRFDVVVACIGAPCVRKGRWIRAFERRGIPWVSGADSGDRNALRRMAAIFGSFEYMTTNTLGSHVAYGSYGGCKVSIWGPYAEFKLEDFRGVPWYERKWQRAKENIERFQEAHVRREYPHLFVDPWEATAHVTWAASLLGRECKREPAEMARLLGWSRAGQAEACVHRVAGRCGELGRAVVRRVRRKSTV